MSYPKQPGQDEQAHRELAQRHLVVVQERDALQARLAAVETEKDEYKRMYDHRGEALLRPCVSCGYRPKEIRTADAASLTRAKSDAAACADALRCAHYNGLDPCPAGLFKDCPCESCAAASRVLAWAREEKT